MQFFQLATYFLGLAITVNAVSSQGTDVAADNAGLETRVASPIVQRRQVKKSKGSPNTIPCGFFRCTPDAKCVTDPPVDGKPGFKHCVKA